MFGSVTAAVHALLAFGGIDLFLEVYKAAVVEVSRTRRRKTTKAAAVDDLPGEQVVELGEISIET